MNAPATSWRRWLPVAVGVGLWTLIGLFMASQTALLVFAAELAGPDLKSANRSAPWPELLRLAMAECYTWGLLSIGIFWLGRRFPLAQGRWLVHILAHLGASLFFSLLETSISVAVNEFLRRDLMKPTFSRSVLQFYFLAKLHQNIVIYWFIVGVGQARDYYRKYRDRELKASQLQARLSQAQLQVLKMQLHPHFLFNTLNAISALIHQDVEVADRMIARLGELLRATLENANQQEVPLHQEMDFIRPYLEIEQARLGSRLSIQLTIEPDTLNAQVPNLLLQPLVENAIRHGIAPRPEPGRLEIRARREAEMLCLEVQDNGLGFHGKIADAVTSGVGLANTRARLERLYGSEQRLELSNGQGKGFQVRVTLPFHARSEPAYEAADCDR